MLNVKPRVECGEEAASANQGDIGKICAQRHRQRVMRVSESRDGQGTRGRRLEEGGNERGTCRTRVGQVGDAKLDTGLLLPRVDSRFEADNYN